MTKINSKVIFDSFRIDHSAVVLNVPMRRKMGFAI
jgi:hypothetical protein